ncbi:hypothetical protein Aph02nite_52990 [Actinoplanes philippinensis]|uniref:Uncharacterized protein n=1 Tax=Actinoplanes philippinensis TaxID=35752 RepID=A0A1I2ILC3_9ACTN|nr:hypothetical protein [Actinoplanes philippinensis]GIE79349.1 hypothetical protein Aph02nite_52990 [Actinoplanes philippinensis]SFF41837.1 hypothetical protein SAMN05421541_11061 [Actinoplanes philippinensis]
MTTPPQPDPAAEKTIGQYLRPLRDLAAYALIAAPAVFLLVAVFELFRGDFTVQTRYSFGSFVNVETIFFPLAAVMLALGVKPVHPKARLITMLALGEYAVASFFGVIFGLLFGVSGIAAQDAGAAFNALLVRVAWLAVLGVAGYALLQVWLGYYPTVKPQPGVYGQPYQPQQYGPPPGYGQQPPYGAAMPGPMPPGTPTPPPVATQPFSVPPAPYGQYPAVPPPAWGAAAPPPPPVPQAPYAEPTQPVPPHVPPVPSAPPHVPPVPSAPPASDRTEVLPDERPGFGPAAQDPPRQ